MRFELHNETSNADDSRHVALAQADDTGKSIDLGTSLRQVPGDFTTSYPFHVMFGNESKIVGSLVQVFSFNDFLSLIRFGYRNIKKK